MNPPQQQIQIPAAPPPPTTTTTTTTTTAESIEISNETPLLPSGHLLELLRNKLVVVHPTTEDEAKQKMNLILEHQSKFPSKLRRIISEAVSSGLEDVQPYSFLHEILEATRAFVFGCPYPRSEDPESVWATHNDGQLQPPFHWWHGLNSDIDKEDEAEVVIRLFPDILSYQHKVSPLSSLNKVYPIYALLVCSKALPFVPLFAELGTELGGFKDKTERAGLTCFMKNVFAHLVSNTLLRDNLRRGSSTIFGNLDESLSRIMIRLKQKGLMVVSDIYNHGLVDLLLHRSMHNVTIRTEQRFRFLIDWEPFVLKDCGRGNIKSQLRSISNNINFHPRSISNKKNNKNNNCTTLMQHHLHALSIYLVHGPRKISVRDFERFQELCELGMSHYPNELGFVFHGTSLELACEIFGTKKVSKLVDDEIKRTLVRTKNDLNSCNSNSIEAITNNHSSSSSRNETLRAMVFAAATNKQISLDGVYTLFRQDPVALLPKDPGER